MYNRLDDSESSLENYSENVTGVIAWRLSVRRPHMWRPPTDLYETEDQFIVRVEIAGMSKEEFDVSLESNTLIISGVRPDMNKKRSFHQMEIPFGDFLTSVELPAPVNATGVNAEYRDGFLNIYLPKLAPKIIQVQE